MKDQFCGDLAGRGLEFVFWHGRNCGDQFKRELLPDGRVGQNSQAMARRRKFNDAMRQRIRDVAASLDLADEEIKLALTLEHSAIAGFTAEHGINLEWLLEGKGRMQEGDQ